MSFMLEKTGIEIKLGFVSFYNYFKNNLKYGFKSPKKNAICALKLCKLDYLMLKYL